MLSRTSKATLQPFHLLSASKRSFFDYVKVANQVDSGNSIAQIEAKMNQEQDQKKADSFGWQWLSWFEQNAPEKYGEYASTRSQFQRWEQYLGERGIKSSKQIDFNEYRNKIADRTFVDDLEVTYNVERDTISSISNMATLDAWPVPSIKSFKEECESKGDLIVAPLSEDEKQRERDNLENAELYDEKMKTLSAELLKDFEQVDAERMMLGQETLFMQLAEHPQYAETLEDIQTAKAAYLDFVMLPIHNDYVKRERLAAIQDETRRKQFLERFELSSKINNGVDCTVPN